MTLFRQLSAAEVVDEDAAGQRQFASITLDDEQNAARKKIVEFDGKVLTVGGYAGVGKTTTMGAVAQDFVDKNVSVAYCAPTGKAASVLRRSLAANGVNPLFCGTIHRLIYKPVTDSSGSVVSWDKADRLPYKRIVVEEASMVSAKVAKDLLSYNVPVVFVGDHGQLPPVGEDTGLMADPMIRLEKVRRQALGNPIIALSLLIRNGLDWRKFVKEDRSGKLRRILPMESVDTILEHFKDFLGRPMSQDPLVITRTNDQRTSINRAIRVGLKTDKLLVPGERVICLKNSYLKEGGFVANGWRARVEKIQFSRTASKVNADLVFPDESIGLDMASMNAQQFGRSSTLAKIEDVHGGFQSWDEVGMLFDYGYAFTCHKVQGSQADHAIVKVERGMMKEDEWRRWMYTATTRAVDRLDLIF